MSSFLALLKVEFKNYMAQTNLNMGVKNKSGLIYVALGVLGFTFISMSFQLSNSLYGGLKQLGQPELTFTIIFSISSLAVLFLSFSALIHLFYYSKNTGFLLTLPIKENVIIFSRLAVQYVYSLVMTSLFLIPCLFVIYINGGFTIVGAIGGVFALFLTPLIPLLTATLLIVLIMGKAVKFISKRAMTVITNVILIGFILGMQTVVIRQTGTSDFILDLLLSESGLLYYFSLRFPPAIWATRMITGSLINMILYLILNVFLIAGASVIITPLTRKSLQDYQQGDVKVKSKTGKMSQNSQLVSLVKRNISIVFKTPAFLMNVISIVILPFILLGINAISGQMSLSQAQQLLEDFTKSNYASFAPLILAVIYILPAFMGSFAATAITREGRFLWQVKTAPISASLDLKARLISCFIMSSFGIVIFFPLTMIFLPVTIMQGAFALVLSLIAILAMLMIDIYIDINRPILSWTSPTHAIKNNRNVFIALAWRVVVVFIGYGLINAFKGFGVNAISYLVGVYLLILLVFSTVLYKQGVEIYKRLDV